MCVLVAQSCPTLYNPMDCSLPGSSVHGILQAKILELFATSLLQGIFPTQGWTRVSCTAGRFSIWATRVAQTISYVYPNAIPETRDELRMINWMNWGNGLADVWAENENWALRSPTNLSKDYPVASCPAKGLKCAFSFQAVWKTTPSDSFLWSRPSICQDIL